MLLLLQKKLVQLQLLVETVRGSVNGTAFFCFIFVSETAKLLLFYLSACNLHCTLSWVTLFSAFILLMLILHWNFFTVLQYSDFCCTKVDNANVQVKFILYWCQHVRRQNWSHSQTHNINQRISHGNRQSEERKNNKQTAPANRWPMMAKWTWPAQIVDDDGKVFFFSFSCAN